MTCLEKLKAIHPHWTDEDIRRTSIRDCPHSYGIMGDPIWCLEEDGNDRCKRCWAREIPEDSPKGISVTAEPFPVKDESPCEYEIQGDLWKTSSTIKDSGDRTQFESGAVRDMREGKGRCDLVPLEVAASVINGTNGAILDHIARFQETGATAELYLALAKFSKTYDDGKTKASFEDIENQRRSTMLLEVAKHFEEGAKKYGESNWRRGIPTYCYIDSAVRHYLKWIRGDNDEPHDRAFVWNLMCCIWEVDYHKKEDKE